MAYGRLAQFQALSDDPRITYRMQMRSKLYEYLKANHSASRPQGGNTDAWALAALKLINEIAK